MRLHDPYTPLVKELLADLQADLGVKLDAATVRAAFTARSYTFGGCARSRPGAGCAFR